MAEELASKQFLVVDPEDSRRSHGSSSNSSNSSNSSMEANFSSWWLIYSQKEASYWILLLLSSITMLVAFPASSILFRLYYVDGGAHRWLLTWVGAAAWPLPALTLLVLYLAQGISPTPMSWPLVAAYAVIGFLSAADNFMFAWSYAYLPASTSALLSSSSLTFTAIFAYLILSKKLNAFSLNAVAIMTAGAVILGLDSSSDRPPGTSNQQYVIGFILDIIGSALHGLIFALSELLFIKLLERKSVHLILEVQTMTSLFACLFTTIAVLVNKDFSEMRQESESFKHGPVSYYNVLIWASITNQLGVLASVAVLYLTSTLLAGVLNAGRVPVTAVASVLCFKDNMSGFKIMSLLLTIWSFGSYIYGGYLENRRHRKRQSTH